MKEMKGRKEMKGSDNGRSGNWLLSVFFFFTALGYDSAYFYARVLETAPIRPNCPVCTLCASKTLSSRHSPFLLPHSLLCLCLSCILGLVVVLVVLSVTMALFRAVARAGMQSARSCAAASTHRFASSGSVQIFTNAQDAISDIQDGSTLLVGGSFFQERREEGGGRSACGCLVLYLCVCVYVCVCVCVFVCVWTVFFPYIHPLL